MDYNLLDHAIAHAKKDEDEVDRLQKERPTNTTAIDQGVLDRAVRYLRAKGIMDEEHVHYNIGKYPVSAAEFDALVNALIDLAIQKNAIRDVEQDDDPEWSDEYGAFGECRTSFRYQGLNFTLSTLFGQGSVTALMEENFNPEYCPFVQDNMIDLNEVFSTM